MTNEDSIQWLKDELRAWGATEVQDRVGTRDGTPIDFHTPFPGDQPISSALIVDDDGQVTKATIRYGVMDESRYDGHPANDPSQIRRIVRVASRITPPVGPVVLANYGDDHYPPRPHLLIGWKPSVAGREEVVTQGESFYPLSPHTALSYITNVGEEYRQEFFDTRPNGSGGSAQTTTRETPQTGGTKMPHMTEYEIKGSEDEDVFVPLITALGRGRLNGVDFDARPVCDPVFKEETEHPVANPNPGATWVAVDFCTRPEDFLELTAEVFRQTNPQARGASTERLIDDQLSQAQRRRARIGLLDDERIVPKPYIQLDKDLNFENQEGRHRGVAARDLGLEWINVRFVAKADRVF